MRIRFEQQLEQLNIELIKMGALCESAINKANEALLNVDKNEECVAEVMGIEDEINQKERVLR